MFEQLKDPKNSILGILSVTSYNDLQTLGKRVLGHSTDYIYTPKSNYLSDLAYDGKFD